MSEEIKSAIFRVFPFLIVLIVLFIRIQQKKINTQELFLIKPFSMKRFLVCTVGFVVFVLLTEFIFYKYGILEVDIWKHSWYPSIIRITGAVILAPIVEELVFRGVFLGMLIQKRKLIFLSYGDVCK